MNNKLNIHFVCRGNVYRSRLAEAYLKSKKLPYVVVSSSGIEADNNSNLAISKLPKIIAKEIGFDSWKNFTWQETTQKLLDSADLIIFLNTDVAKDVSLKFTYMTEKSDTWDVLNLEEAISASNTVVGNSLAINRIIKSTIEKIHTHIDTLIQEVTVSGIVDVVNDANELLGYALPLRWVDRKGLRYRACHGILLTHDNKVITEKRSHEILFSPDLLDISFGGGVDSGESPKEALRREAREELGVNIKYASVTDLGVRKVSHYYPRKKLYTKCFLYSYLIILPEEVLNLSPQLSEVSNIYMLSIPQVTRLIKLRRLSHIGRLNTPYAYYQELFDKVKNLTKSNST